MSELCGAPTKSGGSCRWPKDGCSIRTHQRWHDKKAEGVDQQSRRLLSQAPKPKAKRGKRRRSEGQSELERLNVLPSQNPRGRRS